MIDMRWKVHLPNMLHEILDANSQMAIFRVPFHVTGLLLAEVAERAIKLNDPQLNELMCRLTLFSIADPQSPDYDPEALGEIRAAAEQSHEDERKV